MKNSKKSGIALIIVLMSLALISIFLTQLLYTSNIDLTITKKNQKRLQAYYLAHSGARMGLLRIQIYKELENLIIGQSGIAGMIPANVRPMVWQFPLPEFPLPPTGESEPSQAPGKFISLIKGEGSKIPINLLDGEFHRMPPVVFDKEESQKVMESVKKQIQGLIELRADNDEEFRKKFQSNYPTAYVDSLKDWIDTDSNLTEGGDENNVYERKPLPYKQRNDRITTTSEISMIELWDDDLFRFFKNEFSIINLYPRINCNTVSLDRIRAYSKFQLTDASISLFAKRRMEEPFSSVSECETFIKTNPDIVGGGDFAFPQEVKEHESTRENVFTVEGSSNVGDARALVRLYVRIDEEPPKDEKQDEKADSKKEKLTKFKDVHVIRFEEGAPQ